MNMTRRAKQLVLLLSDVACSVISSVLAFFLIRIYVNTDEYFYFITTLTYLLTYVIIAYLRHAYAKINRYFGLREAADVLQANLVALLVSALVAFLVFPDVSLRYFFLLFFFMTIFTIASRIAWRLYSEEKMAQRSSRRPVAADHVLLVGAGEGGNIFIERFRNRSYNIVGFVDSDPEKLHTYLAHVPVLGTPEDIPEIIEEYNVQMVIITAPSMKPEEKERILELANSMNVPVRQMPNVESALIRRVGPQVEEIKIQELLGRAEVDLDATVARRQIYGKTVLVTGAGGSIGSEICRQLIQFRPSHLLLLGHGENSIYQINRELRNNITEGIDVTPLIADIQDRERIFNIMEQYQPDIIYHAAAHKHVPLMEVNPAEAVKNNVYGAKNVAEAAIEHGVGVFVMVSTDKANNPPNVMGATKRLAEMMLTAYNKTQDKTIFTAVRFGNVLGSRGSVVPLFEEQIARGGPVTVTDERMRRYFMSIPEASRLVIQAGALAKGGEIFILDMGEDVKIVDLARKMIMLSGFTEKEIPIVFTGARPGEKLFEELLLTDETTGEKVDDKIYIGKIQNLSLPAIESFLAGLDLSGNDSGLNAQLVEFVERH